MKRILIIIALLLTASLSSATTVIYRISSGEVMEIWIDNQPNNMDPAIYNIVTDPSLPDGTEFLSPSYDRRVLGYAKIKDGNTVRNATQEEIDGFSAFVIDDKNQAEALKAAEYLANNPNIRKIIKAVSAAFIEYEFNRYRAWFREFENQMALATSLSNLQTRMAALSAAHPMPDRSLSQLYDVVTGKISKDD